MAAPRLPQPSSLPRETIAARYRVEHLLGHGGAAIAYRVVDGTTGRRLALKQLAKRSDAAARIRFRREFHTMARLVHPCVVEVYDFGVAKDGPYYTMELLDGAPLKQRVPLDPVAACRVLRDVASALAFLHARGLVHRDVSPGNVRCTAGGRAKLIDFGIATTAGAAGEIAGTPRFMAPEVLRGAAVDAAADLYGLGALAYWMLTGRHAYNVRAIDELQHAWAHGVARPSALRPELPAALDDLVMSLLGLDRLARPGSAAEVVDRLGAIAGLDRDPELAVVAGYLASGAMIGRDAELQQLRRRIRRLTRSPGEPRLSEPALGPATEEAGPRRNRGGAVAIVAPSGAGKSRLLREASLEGQLAGAAVAHVACETARGPYATVRALARALVATAPDDTLAAARDHAAAIARFVPELAAGADPAELRGDPREDRLAVQHHLERWLDALAQRRALLILIDDVQRCDDASAALLAAVAHGAGERPLLVASALSSDEPARAPEPIAALVRASTELTLRALTEDDTRALARSLFGEVPRLAWLAHQLHERAGGSPLHVVELARHLADRGTLRFVDGVWVIPDALGEVAPDDAGGPADARVAALAPDVRALAELLAVHGGEIPLERTQRLAGLDDAALVEHLEALEYAGMIVRSERGHRFRHDALREAVLRGMTDDRRRALHLALGRLLEAGTVSSELEAEVGWHLLRGGDRVRGAALLERAATRLYDAQSFADAIPLLEAVLDVQRDRRTAPRDRLRVRRMLVVCGAFADRALAVRHAPAAIRGYARYAGIAVALPVARVLGRPLALALGVLAASLRWLVVRPFARIPTPLEAAREWVYAMAAVGPVYSTSYQVDELELMVRDAAILGAARNRAPSGAYLLFAGLLDYLLGDWGALRRKLSRAIAILASDRRTPMRPVERALGVGGAVGVLALEALAEQWPAERIAELEHTELRVAEVQIVQLHIAWHRIRGEEDEARRRERAAEPLLVQAGSMWQNEAWMATWSAMAYSLHRDLMGLRRTIARLSQMTDAGYHYAPFRDVARAAYHAELGELERTRELAEAVLATTAPRERVVRQLAEAALAQALIAAGDHERAAPLARALDAVGRDPELGKYPMRVVAARLLAECEAALGDPARAARRLDEALEEAEKRGMPSPAGLLHEARARLALTTGDRAAFAAHIVAMRRWFLPTRNPALIARIDRLTAEARTAGGGGAEATSGAAPEDVTVRVGSVASQLAGAVGRDLALRALDLLVADAGGRAGHLYLLRGDGRLELVAPAYGDEPDVALVAELLAAIERDGDDDDDDDAMSTRIERPPPVAEWQPVALRVHVDGRTINVGGALVRGADQPLRHPGEELCAAVASALRDRLGAGLA